MVSGNIYHRSSGSFQKRAISALTSGANRSRWVYNMSVHSIQQYFRAPESESYMIPIRKWSMRVFPLALLFATLLMLFEACGGATTSTGGRPGHSKLLRFPNVG